MLTHQEQRQLIAALTIGCTRSAAADYIGSSLHIVNAHADAHPEFHRDIRKAEATAELNHIRNLHTASQDPKSWRASIWFLESRNPERYARKPNNINDNDLAELLAQMMQTIRELTPKENHTIIESRICGLIEATKQ